MKSPWPSRRPRWESASPDTVATVGVVRNEPNAINSIPYRVTLEVDLRDTDAEVRGAVLARIRTQTEKICSRRRLTFSQESINLDPPAIASSELVDSVLHHAEAGRFKARRMISRAYHDSLFMALLCPFTMIFIPCRDGVSHRPDEFSSTAQIAAGISTLARVLADWSVSLA